MELEQHHLDAIIHRLDRQNELLANLALVTAPMILRPPGQQGYEDDNGAGLVTLAWRAFPGGVEKIWCVEKVFLYTNSSGTIAAGVFVMDGLPAGATADNPNTLATAINPLYQKDATTFAVAGGDEIAPIYVKGGESLIFQWSGLSENALCVGSWQGKLAWQGQI